jgi:hypothetical protein
MTSSISLNLDTLVLNEDQDNALNKFVSFLCDPAKQVFLLEGYSGTGKTTLIRKLMDNLPRYIRSVKAIWPDYPDYEVQLTATTNKAADTFSRVTGMDVRTIHSFLELRIHNDFKTGQKVLVPKRENDFKYNYLLFIDEASYINSELLGLIFSQTKGCKIVLMGDRAQLLAPKSLAAPVFLAGFEGAMLEKPMRQMVNGVPQANPITDIATLFRHTVNGNDWPKFKPDGQYVQYLGRADFESEIITEFTRPDWQYHDSKVLAYTNNCVIAYNNAIRNQVAGDPQLQPGDYAENNSFISVAIGTGKGASIKTDQLVYISEIESDSLHHDVLGNWVTVDGSIRVFHPKSRKDKQKYINEQRALGHYSHVREAENWIDLRAVFAQTVNKAQGSTYGTVFIDLDNIKTCTSGNQIARMMYVGISRATTRVVLTGDLV